MLETDGYETKEKIFNEVDLKLTDLSQILNYSIA